MSLSSSFQCSSPKWTKSRPGPSAGGHGSLVSLASAGGAASAAVANNVRMSTRVPPAMAAPGEPPARACASITRDRSRPPERGGSDALHGSATVAWMEVATGPRDVSPDALPAIEPHVIVLFGATGDLARRKLLPGLLHLSEAGLMPGVPGVGTSLEELDDHGFREFAKRSCGELARRPVSPDQLETFAGRLSYVDQGSGP